MVSTGAIDFVLGLELIRDWGLVPESLRNEILSFVHMAQISIANVFSRTLVACPTRQ